jgi:hypothetical protein
MPSEDYRSHQEVVVDEYGAIMKRGAVKCRRNICPNATSATMNLKVNEMNSSLRDKKLESNFLRYDTEIESRLSLLVRVRPSHLFRLGNY